MRKTLIPLTALLLSACAGQPNLSNSNEINGAYSTLQSQLESRFVQMARDGSRSDNWLCFRDKCVDIGFDEQADYVRLASAADLLEIVEENGLEEGELITDYHLNPANGVLEDEVVTNSPPSFESISLHSALKNLFVGRGYRFESKVSDGRGTWTYDTTPEFERTHMRDIMLEDRTNMINYKAELDLPLTGRLSQEQVLDYISRVREYGVILEYTPQNEVASRF